MKTRINYMTKKIKNLKLRKIARNIGFKFKGTICLLLSFCLTLTFAGFPTFLHDGQTKVLAATDYFPDYYDADKLSLVDDISYKEKNGTILNPGVGYTSTISITAKPGNTPVYNPKGSLVLMFVHIGAFSAGSTGHHVNGVYIDGQDSPLDETFFASMRQTLENARKNGCMVAFRFRYDYIGHSKPEPSTFDYLLYHISQIKDNGLLDDYKDIIAFVESGFTGKWGEQHDGKYTSPEYNAKVLDAMLDCVPDHIPVTVRTPATFAAWAGISRSELADYSPEAGSRAARVGLFDDGYMGSDSDLGTYINRDIETGWLSRQINTSYFGGEFAQDPSNALNYAACLPQNAIPEMYKTHLSYINSNIFSFYHDYPFDQAWSPEGVDNSAYEGYSSFRFIRDHLGYRFVLRKSQIQARVKLGADFHLRLNVENTGFANMALKPKAELIFEKDQDYYRVNVNLDARNWLSAKTSQEDIVASLPSTMTAGEWKVYLKLSYGDNELDEMGYRSVEFANYDIYNENLGANYVGTIKVLENCNLSQLTKLDKDGYIPSLYTYDLPMFTGIARAENLIGEKNSDKLYAYADDSYFYVAAYMEQDALEPVYNIKLTNADANKEYWYYHPNSGSDYFSDGSFGGMSLDIEGDLITFKIPLGDMMKLYAGTNISSIRVFIQDQSTSGWESTADLTVSKALKLSPQINIFNKEQVVSLKRDSAYKAKIETMADSSYQWYFNGKAIEGANSSTYSAIADQTGLLSVRVQSEGYDKTIDMAMIKGIYNHVEFGDLTLDDEFDAVDLVMLKRYLLNKSEIKDEAKILADANGDGQIDIEDLLYLEMYLAGYDLQ